MANKKYGDILKDLRLGIVSGKLPPGSHLPTRIQLKKRFDASNQTIQVAMNSLIRDGFVWTNRSGGTIVAENPPHLCRYGLVSSIPFSESRFMSTMQQAAMKLADERECSFTYYCYENGHINSEGYKRLIADVESHRVAGLIFLTPPFHLDGTPVLLQSGLPRVSNCGHGMKEGVANIYFDHQLFLVKATDHLVKIGRKRIAMIGGYLNREDMEKDISYLMGRKVSRPLLTQNCTPWYSWSAHQAALLLMGLSEKERPDALIIRDDHLVEAATEGLANADVRIPEDMTIVAHSNFPDRATSCVPVTRLGLDCEDMIRRDVECLKAQRQGSHVQLRTNMPAVFESEIISTRTGAGRQVAEDMRHVAGYGRQERGLRLTVSA